MTTRSTPFWVAAMVSLAFSAAGCEADQVCGEGTRLEDGVCVAACAPGTERDPATGGCVPVCVEGTHRDPETGGCLPDGAECASGHVWDPYASTCIDVNELCAEGTTWVASQEACVRNEMLREPDYRAGDEENDPVWGGPGAFETFTLPENDGETVTFAGSIDEPRYRDGSQALEPDFDLWVFEAEEPVLIRTTVDGIGGATSGFQVFSIDPDVSWVRMGIASTSDDVTRDLFIPTPGIYAFYMSDALNYASFGPGPYHGGGDMGYFVELERMAFPEPEPLEMVAGSASVEGEWPLQPPEEGLMIGFYSVEVDEQSMYAFQVEPEGQVEEQIYVFGERSSFIANKWGRLHGYVDEQELILVADYALLLGLRDGAYRLAVEESPSVWIPDQQTVVTDQPAWQALTSAPFAFHGYEALANEIVTVEVESSTGRTCWDFYGAYVDFPLHRINCHTKPGLDPVFEGRFRMITARDGFHSLSTFDWLGATWGPGEELEAVPAHSYETTHWVERQTPLWAEDVETPFVVEDEPLDESSPERFVLADPGRGVALVGRVAGEINPETTVYEPYFGVLRPAGPSVFGDIAARSFDGAPLLFGVRDADDASAGFDLELSRMSIDDLGPTRTDSYLEETALIAAGESWGILQISAEMPGHMEVAVETDTNLSATIMDIQLVPVTEPVPLMAGMPPRALFKGVNEEGMFVKLATPDGEPLELDAEISVRASLEPAIPSEQSDVIGEAQELELPAIVVGSLHDAEKLDVYAVELSEPGRIVAATLPTGHSPAQDTIVAIADPMGRILETDERSGPGLHARVEYVASEPGVYLVGVQGRVSGPSDYVLEVLAELP